MRHARLLVDLGLEVAVVSRRSVKARKAYRTIPDAVADWAPDYVVVASRTNEHRQDMAVLAANGFRGTVLMEKPLFDQGDHAPEHAFKRVFVGYNLRFHPVVRRFKEILDGTTPYAVHAYVGQSLSDWRSGSDYRKGYSGAKSQGGGVLRDLSHELDFLNWILGGWKCLTASGGKFSQLEIDSDDVFSVLFEARRCPVVTVQMNYLDSVFHRQLVALTDKGSLRADIARGTIEFRETTEHFNMTRDDTYIAEHEAVLSGDTDTLCSLEEGRDVMRMIAAAETAAREQTWVAH